MSWIYHQSTGILTFAGQAIAVGCSGFGKARNDPKSESIVDVGPTPRGTYHASEPFDSITCGPVCMHLSPFAGTDTFTRGGFLIHGDAAEHPGAMSHGCIILPRWCRELIAASRDRIVEVV